MNDQPGQSESHFPILDEEVLLAHPKSQESRDMERIYTSPNSEDWVTWNILRALQRSEGTDWWDSVVAAAEADADPSADWSLLSQPPSVEFWRRVDSPAEYETASRERMRTSQEEAWRERTVDTRPVEGRTEVDLVFESDQYLVYVETKLHSDISQSTTYDPDRNQIARNIDCLIEDAGDRAPFFWMFVRDRLPSHTYQTMIELYRHKAPALHQLLPHRDPELLDRIINSIAIVTWEDLFPIMANSDVSDEIREELRRRICDVGSTTSPARREPLQVRPVRRQLSSVDRIRRALAARLRKHANDLAARRRSAS